MEKGLTIDVLDHGYVRWVDSMGDDLSVVRAARVSHDADWRSGEDSGKDEKLIRYLMRNHHTSPFEHVSITFDVKCPIFVARQWMRHRTWKYNEISARYTELPGDIYVPDIEHLTKQDAKNHQSRTNERLPEDVAVTARALLQMNANDCYGTYEHLLEIGVPRELARSVLPVGTYTRFFATVDLHNLFHFLRLRLDAHSQYEIRVYAEAIKVIAKHVAPVSTAAFLDTIRGEEA